MSQMQDEHIPMMDHLCAVTQELISTQDEEYLLDRILSQARKLLRAESGSIFVARGDLLHFTYVQNQKMFEGSTDLRGKTMPIDTSSLAGYVAATGEPLLIEDAHHLPSDVPYGFNKSYDQSTGYRSRSMLVLPLTNSQGKVIGVLQLINALNGSGEVVGFDPGNQGVATFFANSAAFALERAMIHRELILRMMRMAELRDPKETGAHVNRVGGYAAVIYEAWATKQGIGSTEMAKNQDLIRVAAMLHDVGKVAISDSILKKPGKLDDDEYHTMKFHTVRGAQLFGDPSSEVDRLAQEIALNHHERWDGKGYPGHIDDLFVCHSLARGKKKEEPPIAARVTALADVYDALMSKRAYKDPWPEEKVVGIIKEERGAQFDPAVVDAFMQVYDEVARVRRLYAEEQL